MYSRSPSKKSLHISEYKEEKRKLPTNWERRISNNVFPNRPYYFNLITNESKWDFPGSTISRHLSQTPPPQIRGHSSRGSHSRGSHSRGSHSRGGHLRGGVLQNILYHFEKDDFVTWYNYKKDDLNENDYEIFKDLLLYCANLFSCEVFQNPLRILVGATNMYHDYDRFKDSNLYDLYIGEEVSTNIERQYDMYTIGYQNIFSNMGLYLVGRVWQIHFDISVAYFCPIDYLKLAENILIPGCKIVFDLAQHMGMVCIFNRELNIFYLGRHAMTKEEIENRYNVVINVDKQVITPRITNGIYGSGHLSPQIGLNIFDSRTNKPFKRDLYRGYIDYCREKYPRLSFAEKTYSYANYSYPVPIKTINQEIDSYNSIFNFIANNVMTLSERIDYIRNKRLSDSQINEFINRVLSRTRLFNNFCQETDTDHTRPNIDQYITGRINYEIKLNNEYIEGTKI